jgi:hypothetical protein
MRYSHIYDTQLHLRGTATPTRYSYICEVKLHLQGQLHLPGMATTMGYSYFTPLFEPGGKGCYTVGVQIILAVEHISDSLQFLWYHTVPVTVEKVLIIYRV